jgi:hypothetical protein
MSFNEEHIDENLLGKSSGGFDVPDGYFETLQKNILNKTSENGFFVPDGYFENLETRIQQRIPKGKTIPLNPSIIKKYMIGVAASILFIAGFFLIKNKTSNNLQTPIYSGVDVTNLSNEDIINYVDIEDITDSHIGETALNTNDKTQKQVEDYLLNNADEELIID